MNKVSAWISAARLRTLPLSIAGILAGSCVAVKTADFSLPIFILALGTTLGAHGTGVQKLGPCIAKYQSLDSGRA